MQKHKNTSGMREQRSKPHPYARNPITIPIVDFKCHERGVDHVKHSKANDFPYFTFQC